MLVVGPVHALSLESLCLETSVLVYRYIFRMSRSSLYRPVKVIGSRSRSQEQKNGIYKCKLNIHNHGCSGFDSKTLLFGCSLQIFMLAVGIYAGIYIDQNYQVCHVCSFIIK